MLRGMDYRFSEDGLAAFVEYISARRLRPHFANARSIRNALDRARLRQAVRLFQCGGRITADDLQTLEAAEIRASRVLATDTAEESFA
jgi:hypothetical protein